jgi:phosphoribosylaminoimidazole-succinocarboxamide synthase
MPVQILEPFYEGKAKVLFATSDPQQVVHYFKDDATAFNRKKVGTIAGKGPMNLRMTARLYRLLQDHGVPTHLLEVLDDRRLLTRRLTIVPLEVIVRNRVAGSFARRYGLEEGKPLPQPLVEFCYKKDELDDPLITPEAAVALGLASTEALAAITAMALQINEILREFLAVRGIELVDFKLEFGRDAQGLLQLADEISPDSCRFWEIGTGRRLDKDRFRQDLGDVEAAYAEMLQRIENEPSLDLPR